MVRNLSDNDIAILLSSESCSENSKQDISVTGKRCKKRLDYKTLAGIKNTSKPGADIKKCNNSSKSKMDSSVDETSVAKNSIKPKGKKLVHFIENKDNQQGVGNKSLRKKERVDYLSMFRGSSLLPNDNSVNSPEKPSLNKSKNEKLNQSRTPNKSKNQTLNKSKDQTLNKTCIYRQFEDDDDAEPIRPSQVFEFSFDPQEETKIKVETKKKAKILKKMIREKACINKIKNEVKVMKKPQILLPRLTFGDHLLFKTPKAKEVDKAIESSTEKEPMVVLQRLTFNTNLHAKPQSTPNQKEIETAADIERIEEQNDAEPTQDDLDGCEASSHILNPEISAICDNFDDITNESVAINNTTNNQSIPWRLDVPNKPRAANLSYLQNLSTSFSKTSSKLTPETDCSLFQSNIKQTSISNYLNQDPKCSKSRPNSDRKTVHFNNDVCLKSPAGRSSISSLNSSRSDTSISDISNAVAENIDKCSNRRSSLRSCSDTSMSDVSQGEQTCSDENIERYSNKKSLLRKMDFNAAVTSSPSTKILGDKNVFHKKSSLKQLDGFKKSDRVRFTEAEKENRFTNFGFDDSNTELIEKRKSKKPIRISTTDLNKVLKQPQQLDTVATTDTINDTDVTEPTDATEVTENYSADLDDTEPTDQVFGNEIFEEPRFTHLIRRSYSRYDHMGKKRKKAFLESSDEHIESIEEHVPKKVRKNKIKDKESIEFEKWASQFNSACEEVDKEELIVETSVCQ